MPIVQVQLPDGRIVAVHAEPQAEKPNPILSAGKTLFSNLARGFGQGLAGLAEGAAAFNSVDSPNRSYSGSALTEAVQKALPVPENESRGERFVRKVTEGAGAGLSTPIPMAGVANTLLRNAATGAAAGAGSDLGESALGAPGAFAGGMLAGGAAGFLTGPRQSVAQQDIRRELNHLTPADFQKAERNLNTINAAGSKTATLVDAFEGSPRIKGLANRVQNERGGEALAQRTAGRVEDRQQLGQALLNRISPNAVSETATANNLADAAGGVLERQKNSRSAYMGRQLQGKSTTPADSFDMFARLHQAADNEVRKGPADALREVADSLVDQHGRIITDVQQLSLALKALKDAPKNPIAQVKGGSAISDRDMAEAIRAAENLLKRASPDFARGNAGFAGYSQNVMRPTREGPIGAMADKNPLLAGPTPLSRIEGTLSGETPEGIERVLGMLQRPGYTGGAVADTKSLARALAQRKLDRLPQNPGESVRGAPGSLDDDRFAAVLRSAGLDADSVTQPLRAADLLKDFGPATTIGGMPPMRLKQYALRPFRTVDMATSLQTETKINKQIAELLARNDLGGLRDLQKIAAFDPTTRKLLIAKGLFQPAAGLPNNEGN